MKELSGSKKDKRVEKGMKGGLKMEPASDACGCVQNAVEPGVQGLRAVCVRVAPSAHLQLA
jgi:hypothetical protein